MAKSKGLEERRTISSLYSQYEDTALLSRLETYALWTIPSVFPTGDVNKNSGNATIEHDYQSHGALLVNRLSSKLAGTLFPVNTSFFRIDANEELEKQLKANPKSAKSLVELETKACRRLFLNASYAQLVQALRLLVITGECLLVRLDNRVNVYSLKNYVLCRNNVGVVQEIILREPKLYAELSEETQALVGEHKPDERLDLYTRVKRQVREGRLGPIVSWNVTQEIKGKALNTSHTYRDKLCPYIPVWWNLVNGDAYGRGYVEEYAGDFAKLSELSQALTEYELQALRVLHVYNPSAAFDVDSAVDGRNGDWIQGNKDAVQQYEVGSYQKILEIRTDVNELMVRLNTAFMYTGNSRDAERVTAFELQLNAEEAEQVLGGVYSQLSQNMHLPLAYLLLHEVHNGVIHSVDKGEIELNILTGLQALSRSTETQALMIVANQMNTILPIFDQATPRIDKEKIIDKLFTSNGIDLTEVMKSEQRLREDAEAEQAAAAAQQQQLIQQQNAQLQATQAAGAAMGGPDMSMGDMPPM